MTNYLVRRLITMAIVVVVSTFIIYLLLNLAPGGPLCSGPRLRSRGWSAVLSSPGRSGLPGTRSAIG